MLNKPLNFPEVFSIDRLRNHKHSGKHQRDDEVFYRRPSPIAPYSPQDHDRLYRPSHRMPQVWKTQHC
ncbi:hypothetical protein XM38_041090 [Halomicronema hongdechloris C2206]|uniref:Uncharacterized protein n=1 Tax=Halomicronema hongdechloris C2206 TaxID=1641165 RepID=A0A1Z3HSP4_9CYAN|nr:hypothetical protein XM38_041090 [Halomicronema hongdechloris C2206]